MCFQRVNLDKVKIFVRKIKITYCTLDPLPFASIIGKGNFNGILCIIVDIINLSIDIKKFPESKKQNINKPRLKGKLDSQFKFI